MSDMIKAAVDDFEAYVMHIKSLLLQPHNIPTVEPPFTIDTTRLMQPMVDGYLGEDNNG